LLTIATTYLGERAENARLAEQFNNVQLHIESTRIPVKQVIFPSLFDFWIESMDELISFLFLFFFSSCSF